MLAARAEQSQRRYRRILLVNPNNEDHASFVILPHLGLGYLASALKRSGYDISLWDGLRRNASVDDLMAYIKSHGPFDVIGISIFTTFFKTAQKYAARIRQAYPNVVLLAGGPHATFESEQTLRDIPEVDFLVAAEGEHAVPMLLDHLNAGKTDYAELPNLVWRNGEEIEKNAVRFLPSLDEFPTPDWELLEPDKFALKPNGIFTKAKRIIPMVVTRGCPYVCTFCGAPTMTGRPLRRRAVENVLDEIEQLQKTYGVDEFHFMDDNFTLHPSYLQQFCQGVIDRGLKIWWACPNGVRLDSLRPGTLKLMQQSGCYSFAVGIEVGTQRMLDVIKKDLTLETIRAQLDMIRETTPKIRVTGFFILGLPEESVGDVLKTILFAMTLPIHRANFFNYSPFPGNEIYANLKASGQIENLDFSKVYIHSLSYEHPRIRKWQLRLLMQVAHVAFYLRPAIIVGLLREIHSLSQVEIIGRRVLAIMRGKV